MKRSLYSEDHERFRESFRTFLRAEVVPHQARWLEAGAVDRDVWRKAGAAGFLCPSLPVAFGGRDRDFLYSCVINEELASIYETGLGIRLHSDTAVPVIHANADDEQRRRWLPGCANGELVVAVALTEPEGGSDLSGLSAQAVREGDEYVLDGVKTLISNGMMCDLCVVAAATGSVSE